MLSVPEITVASGEMMGSPELFLSLSLLSLHLMALTLFMALSVFHYTYTSLAKMSIFAFSLEYLNEHLLQNKTAVLLHSKNFKLKLQLEAFIIKEMVI